MATPVKQSSGVPTTSAPVTPVPVVRPLGWVLALAAGLGLVLATWVLYPTDYDGMWAGYRDGVIGTVALIAVMALRSSLPERPSIGVLALCGLAAVLFAVFLDNPQRVLVSELAAGIALLVGAALLTATGRR